MMVIEGCGSAKKRKNTKREHSSGRHLKVLRSSLLYSYGHYSRVCNYIYTNVTLLIFIGFNVRRFKFSQVNKNSLI